MADPIKPEIKLSPATTPTNNLSTLPDFEDDTDLHFPPADRQAWLLKLPKYLWEAWSDIYDSCPDDGHIEIGKVLVHKDDIHLTDPAKQRIQIRLAAGVPGHVDLPKHYELNITTSGYSNHVIFSEKDLPGHRRGQAYGGRKSHLATAAKPTGIPLKSERYGQQNNKVGGYRTAIPKQTALAPLVEHVADATPVQDESYFAHFTKSYNAVTNPPSKTNINLGIDRQLHPGATNSTFANFGSLTSRPSARKKKTPKEKAVRISQGDLLDAIYKCFRRYRYWSLKALRNELKQPETYIKETLDGIATLVRSGDFAMNYVLKPEYANTANIKPEDVKEETAVIRSEDEGGESVGMSGVDDMDEDLDEFEDVKMEGR